MKKIFILFLFVSCSEDSMNPIKDASGNEYQSVKIGNQVWLSSNLKTTRLNTGSSVQYWDALSGKFYPWSVVHGDDICPNGFRVASQQDWKILIDYYGGMNEAGNSLVFDFKSVPSGYRSSDGNVYSVNEYSYWWTSSGSGSAGVGVINLDGDKNIFFNSYSPEFGMCVRCIKK